jgi:hypothetical protein
MIPLSVSRFDIAPTLEGDHSQSPQGLMPDESKLLARRVGPPRRRHVMCARSRRRRHMNPLRWRRVPALIAQPGHLKTSLLGMSFLAVATDRQRDSRWLAFRRV